MMHHVGGRDPRLLQTVAVVAVQEGLLQLGSTVKVRHGSSFLMISCLHVSMLQAAPEDVDESRCS